MHAPAKNSLQPDENPALHICTSRKRCLRLFFPPPGLRLLSHRGGFFPGRRPLRRRLLRRVLHILVAFVADEAQQPQQDNAGENAGSQLAAFESLGFELEFYRMLPGGNAQAAQDIVYPNVLHRLAVDLSEHVKLPGSVSRQVALQLTIDSPILLLLLNQQPNAKGRIPGKLFEYLASRRPILCLGPTDSDVAGILMETDAGRTADYEDEAGIRAALEELYQKFQAGKLAQPVDSSIEAYSIEKLTGQVAGFLDEIVKG